MSTVQLTIDLPPNLSSDEARLLLAIKLYEVGKLTLGQAAKPALQPPPVCCTPIGIPPAGQPAPVNMAYFGGHVQVTPAIYLYLGPGGTSMRRPSMVSSQPRPRSRSSAA